MIDTLPSEMNTSKRTVNGQENESGAMNATPRSFQKAITTKIRNTYEDKGHPKVISISLMTSLLGK